METSKLTRMTCPNCESSEVYPDPGYETVFRCKKCGRIGSQNDFHLTPCPKKGCIGLDETKPAQEPKQSSAETGPMSVLELDFIPPTTNHIWKHRVLGGFACVYMTAEGKQFKRDVQAEATRQGIKLTQGPITVLLALTFPDQRRRDIDNYTKGLFDALSGYAWEDDSQIVSLQITKRHIAKQARTTLTVIKEE